MKAEHVGEVSAWNPINGWAETEPKGSLTSQSSQLWSSGLFERPGLKQTNKKNEVEISVTMISDLHKHVKTCACSYTRAHTHTQIYIGTE